MYTLTKKNVNMPSTRGQEIEQRSNVDKRVVTIGVKSDRLDDEQ